jgi:hypothetical protein
MIFGDERNLGSSLNTIAFTLLRIHVSHPYKALSTIIDFERRRYIKDSELYLK